MNENLITQKKAAEFLACSPHTLQAWRVRGGGPRHVRIGKRSVRYDLADLRAYVDSQRAGSAVRKRLTINGRAYLTAYIGRPDANSQ